MWLKVGIGQLYSLAFIYQNLRFLIKVLKLLAVRVLSHLRPSLHDTVSFHTGLAACHVQSVSLENAKTV